MVCDHTLDQWWRWVTETDRINFDTSRQIKVHRYVLVYLTTTVIGDIFPRQLLNLNRMAGHSLRNIQKL